MRGKDEKNNEKEISAASDEPKRGLSPDEIRAALRQIASDALREKFRKREESKLREKEDKARKEREAKEAEEAHIREVTSMDLPMDWENVFDSDERTRGVHAESVPDALILSLTSLGRVDIEYMSSITGEDYKSVICALKGAIYQNPETWEECFYKGWETAEEYLSGNLMRKWKAAKQADEKYKGYFADNVKAIEKVIPPTVATKDIYVTIGSPWIPPDVIDDFILHLFGDPFRFWRFNAYEESYYRRKFSEEWKTKHEELTGTWEIPEKSRYNHSVGVTKQFGTDRMEALHILEKTLNMKTIVVTDEVKSETNASGKKRVVNREETVAAAEKQRAMIEAFRKWIWRDPARKERLEKVFEERYGAVRRRLFDGSFLTFPGASPEVALYPYQKDAVARILFTPNTLLAHDVGAGKTYVMIAAGQELRRMRLSERNLYVVPNNIVGQWRDLFLKMYPTAKLLLVEPKSFTPAKRQSVLREILKGEYDAIVMAYSCFSEIPISRKVRLAELRKKQAAISAKLKENGKATSALKKKLTTVEKEIATELALSGDDEEKLYFDDLGITRLFVDEAHNFKNVPFDTATTMTLGINAAGSARSKDMLDKVRVVQKRNGGKGVVFATGTPITNSITDAFIMQKYLQNGELAMLDLQNFDSWIGMFAEKVTEFEIDVDTNAYRLATRFASFHNLPELTSLLSSIADFHAVDEQAGLPYFSGYHDAVVGKTPAFGAYLKMISDRADSVRSGLVDRKDDNMLKITTDGRKAALDLRLVSPTAAFNINSKVARCAENVAEIYFRTSVNRSTQLVFCDTSTPKDGFNLYDELKRLLVEKGVPEREIAYVHDAVTERQREILFEKVRKGVIRVLLGSTFKLGLGVNIQNRLIALHHLDVPWRPADMTQREGRILRQGNENARVFIFRYIAEESFDAYSWQLLETKQRFISGLLSGSMTERSGSDVADVVLAYAEVKALAIGNPLIKERVEAANELSRFMTLQRKLVEQRERLEKERAEIPVKIKNQRELIEKCEEDRAYYEEWTQTNPPVEDKAWKEIEAEKRKELRARIGAAVRANVLEPSEKRAESYRGFEIVLPANMLPTRPYLYLERKGRYVVDLGETDAGILIRIDHCLESLGDRAKELTAILERLKVRAGEIESELSKEEGFAEIIEEYKNKVEQLDKKLGVKEK